MMTTDYLVVGAGAASLAFIDSLLTEQPQVRIVLVDEHDAPGGHWNNAYGYVHLHQPSLLYGVASEPLEGSWLKLVLKDHILPWKHRASKTEILTYYQRLVDRWVASGNVRYFPNCRYDFKGSQEAENGDQIHSFVSITSAHESPSQSYDIRVKEKLVNGILGACRVPSTSPPTFRVDENVSMMTPNQVYEMAGSTERTRDRKNALSFPLFRKQNKQQTSNQCNGKTFVVLGCGKTVSALADCPGMQV